MLNYNESGVNALRFLSVDAIQLANSGHPGMPLGMADIAAVLWQEFLQHNPLNPQWVNRDRFILSNGHGSMLLYALLHLTGYDLSISDLKQFRQLHSRTPGHPEWGVTPGVETTTGPLGQGLANGVGMALAEKILSAQFNRPDCKIIDHYTYVFLGDGCLMEGISHEVASFAGTHGLGKLIIFWDNNSISIDGNTEGWFTEDVAQRFRAYHWQVLEVEDGHDHTQIRQAVYEAKENHEQPTLICCKTIIGRGAPNLCNQHGCHGTPLGPDEISLMREQLAWPYEPFVIPESVYEYWDAKVIGAQREQVWNEKWRVYQRMYPTLAAELQRRLDAQLPPSWLTEAQQYSDGLGLVSAKVATRQASQDCLNYYAPFLPELLGGSADLTPSNLTKWKGAQDITKEQATGNYLHYGVREFGMFALMNGIALHGGFIPYAGTFLVFANYGQSAIRMAAMMRKRVIYVFTHDTIGVGEDGATHQPVEHLAMLRATPNLSVWRPADQLETATAWQVALMRQGPTALILARQKVEALTYDSSVRENLKKGGYILSDSLEQLPEIILLAAGSEVSLACKVAEKLKLLGKQVRVVSMPSHDTFDQQEQAYIEKVLPAQVKKRVAIEAAAALCWHKYVGLEGQIISLDSYGASAPGDELFDFFGFTVDKIIAKVL